MPLLWKATHDLNNTGKISSAQLPTNGSRVNLRDIWGNHSFSPSVLSSLPWQTRFCFTIRGNHPLPHPPTVPRHITLEVACILIKGNSENYKSILLYQAAVFYLGHRRKLLSLVAIFSATGGEKACQYPPSVVTVLLHICIALFLTWLWNDCRLELVEHALCILDTIYCALHTWAVAMCFWQGCLLVFLELVFPPCFFFFFSFLSLASLCI